MKNFYVFCDESCHQYKGHSNVMAIGGVLCAKQKYITVKKDIKLLKDKHGFSFHEIKWSRVSLKHIQMYKELIDYFFNSDFLTFSSILILNRKSLDKVINNAKDYENSYFYLYSILIVKMTDEPDSQFSIFIDRKDNKADKRIRQMHDAIKKNSLTNVFIQRIESIDSKSSLLIQLADFFSGCLTYIYRGLNKEKNADRCKVELSLYLKNKIDENKHKLTTIKKFSILAVKI